MFRFLNSQTARAVLFFAAALPAATSFADGQSGGQSQIPSTAVLLFQEEQSNVYNDTPVSEACKAQAQMVIHRVPYDLSTKNTEFDCQAVYFHWSLATPSTTAGRNVYTTVTLTLDAYCVPRTLQQRQILSLEKACETDPKPQCYQKDFLDYLGNLQPTAYIGLDNPGC